MSVDAFEPLSSAPLARGVAYRLIDYRCQAPTMSFLVAGTLMVEPTESRDLREVERLIEAMIAIGAEIDAIAFGAYTAASSPLRDAPHTAELLVGEWDRPSTPAEAVYPAGTATNTYWPPVRRIGHSHGGRNLVYSCPFRAFEA